jgi:hypothetical protein
MVGIDVLLVEVEVDRASVAVLREHDTRELDQEYPSQDSWAC